MGRKNMGKTWEKLGKTWKKHSESYDTMSSLPWVVSHRTSVPFLQCTQVFDSWYRSIYHPYHIIYVISHISPISWAHRGPPFAAAPTGSTKLYPEVDLDRSESTNHLSSDIVLSLIFVLMEWHPATSHVTHGPWSSAQPKCEELSFRQDGCAAWLVSKQSILSKVVTCVALLISRWFLQTWTTQTLSKMALNHSDHSSAKWLLAGVLHRYYWILFCFKNQEKKL